MRRQRATTWTRRSITTNKHWNKITGLQVYVEDVEENPRCFVGATKFAKANGKKLESLPEDCVEDPPEDFVQDRRVSQVVHMDRMEECIRHLHPEYTNERVEHMLNQVRAACRGEKREPELLEEEEEDEELEPAAPPPRKQHSPPGAQEHYARFEQIVQSGNQQVIDAIKSAFDYSIRRDELLKYQRSDAFKRDAEGYKQTILKKWAETEGRQQYQAILERKRADFERRAEEQVRLEMEPRLPEIRARIEAQIESELKAAAVAKSQAAPKKTSLILINDEDFNAFEDLVLSQPSNSNNNLE